MNRVNQADYARPVARQTSRDMSAVGVTFRDARTGGPLAVYGDATPEDGGGPLGAGLQLQNRFVADIADPEFPFSVSMTIAASDGRLVCESLTITKLPNGHPVIGTSLRSVVVDSYLARVRQELQAFDYLMLVQKRTARETVVDDGGREFTVTESRGASQTELSAFEELQRRDRPVQVNEVAELYQAALASDNPRVRRAPTATVARQIGIHRSYAAALVSRARQAGLLPPADRRSNTG